MSRIQQTVSVFLSKPLTTQQHMAEQFGFIWDYSQDHAVQRNLFFTSVKKAGRVEEFCNYVLGETNE